MTVTFAQPDGSTLTTRAAPVAFTTTGPLLAVSVAYPDRMPEPAYVAGAWTPLYAASSQVGTTYTLRRKGGWPSAPTVYVDEAPPAAPEAMLHGASGWDVSRGVALLPSGYFANVAAGLLFSPVSLPLAAGLLYADSPYAGLRVDSSGRVVPFRRATMTAGGSYNLDGPTWTPPSSLVGKIAALTYVASATAIKLYLDETLVSDFTYPADYSPQLSGDRWKVGFSVMSVANAWVGGAFVESNNTTGYTQSDVAAWVTALKRRGAFVLPPTRAYATGYAIRQTTYTASQAWYERHGVLSDCNVSVGTNTPTMSEIGLSQWAAS